MGSQSSGSNSRPLTASERMDLYNAYMGDKYTGGSGLGASSLVPASGDYKEASTYDPGTAKTLTNGDYNKLQSDVLAGNTAGLDRAKSLDLQQADSSAAKRGIWSSGLAMKAANDVSERYAPQYTQAGANATQQRYGLQSQELNNLNQYNLGRSSMLNQTGTQRSQDAWNAKWRPAEYLSGVWNGTNGVVSSGSSGGWSI